jgi:hypothetical protein
VGNAFANSAHSSTLTTNAGTLSSTGGSDLTLASIGFISNNESSLGIHAVRTSTGSDWTTSAITQ